MGKLFLDSLEIQNFRGFRHLQIEKLGRVNLIVGKNNIGKTALLEALELYARRGSPNLIRLFLRTRNELSDSARRGLSSISGDDELDRVLEALRYLFYGRKEIKGNSLPGPLRIGSINSSTGMLMISLGWFTTEPNQPEGVAKWRLLQPEEYLMVDNPIPRFSIEWGQQKINVPILARLPLRVLSQLQEANCISIGVNGLTEGRTSLYWGRVALTDLEQEVLNALQIIAPGVSRLAFISDSEESSRVTVRVPLIKVKDIDAPFPFRGLGNGMSRILGLTLALVNAQDGILLIDEIENGIHYSAQQELWQMIFRLAGRLNIQVFATTHSWDCIEAFQKAAKENAQEKGMLIRLSLEQGEIDATLFDEEELQIVTRERMEVR
jgi:ABC-type cobalamin/Fe3+-siderophores transport system ATPase subunit